MDVKAKFEAIDPNDRFVDLAQRLGWAKPAADVDSLQVQQLIQGTDIVPVKRAVAQRLALRTVLTNDQATRIVTDAFDRMGGDGAVFKNPSKAAQAVNAAANTATESFSANLILSDPVMLGPWARLSGAAVMGVGVLLSLEFISTVSATSTNWAYGALAALGLGCLIGILVLIMGYKNVTIEGSGSPTGN